jgi:hypothetical protein
MFDLNRVALKDSGLDDEYPRGAWITQLLSCRIVFLMIADYQGLTTILLCSLCSSCAHVCSQLLLLVTALARRLKEQSRESPDASGIVFLQGWHSHQGAAAVMGCPARG